MKREMMNQINRIVLNVLYRGLRVLYQKDSRVRAEMGSWAEGLSLKLVCGPGGAVLAVRKDEQHGLCRLYRRVGEQPFDLRCARAGRVKIIPAAA